MTRLVTIFGIAALTGALLLSACVERESPAADLAGEPDGASATPTKSPDPLAPSTQQPIPSIDPDDPEASTLDIPRFELSSGNREIYLMNADGGNHERLTDDQAQYHHPVWSPDGSRIASVTFNRNQPGESIFVMDADGTDRQEISDAAGGGRISWSPDGETIAFSTVNNPRAEAEEIHVIDAEGSNQRRLTDREDVEPGERYRSPSSPAWSPDGESIVFSAIREQEERTGVAVVELYIVDVAGDEAPRLLTDSPEIQKGDPLWSPDGQTIVFSGFMNEGTEQALYAVDAGGGNLRQLTDEVNHPAGMTWSPDGDRIAFSQELFANQDIYVMDADGANIKRLTDDDTANESPAWSPDGSRIAYIANRDARLAEPCSFGVDFDFEPHRPFDELAWSAEHIVVGTVTDVLGPDWGEPRIVRRSGNCLEIMTDYIIEVDERYYGEDLDTLRVRAPGGEIGPYSQTIGAAPVLEEGDQYLFFLFRAPESELLPDAWGFDHQRAKPVSPSGNVSGGRTDGDVRQLDLDEVEQIINDSLAGDPPADFRGSLWGWTDDAIDRDLP